MSSRPCRWIVVVAFAAGVAAAQGVPQEIDGGSAAVDVEGLRAAVARHPRNAGLKLRLAKATLDRGETSRRGDLDRVDAEVAALFRETLELNPEAIIPLRAFTREAYYRRRFAEATDYARKACKVEPADVDVATLYVKSLAKLGRDQEAADFLLDWVASGLSPGSGAVQGLVGGLAARAEMRAALDAAFARRLEQAPRHILLRLTYASYLAEVGRVEEAWNEFRRAERDGLCDLIVGARHAFASTLASRAPEPAPGGGPPAGADVVELRKAADADPEHVGLRLRLARRLEPVETPGADPAALKAGREAALVEYLKAATLNPAAWSAHLRAAELLVLLERPAEAVPHVGRALEMFPENVAWRLVETEARLAAGDVAGAAEAFTSYASRYEADGPVRRMVAAFEARGAKPWDAFVAALEKAAAAAPRNPWIKSNLAYLRLKKGDVAGARAAAREAEEAGLVGLGGVQPHAALIDAWGLAKKAESAPAK
ncbi:MAG TPA: hypothetical protein VEI02_06145 [Planctomycetota bacterium]|nr:hypothetical protein [Planctomycetota bacterium]